MQSAQDGPAASPGSSLPSWTVASQGCALVGEALPLIDERHPGRVGRKLADWNREATRYAGLPIVRDTQDQVHALAATT